MENHEIEENSCIKDHLANERTFLAWVRTSIGIMAFGFVVEKFTLFIREMTFILGGKETPKGVETPHFLGGYSSAFGALFVVLGTLICLLAFSKYKKTQKQIENDTYNPLNQLSVVLTLSVLLIGVFLLAYLNLSQ